MQISQVMIPFGAVVSFSLIVLILWQILDPMVWVREITNEDAEGSWKSYGECNSEGDALPFIIPLGIIIFLCVFMAGAISWKLKDVQGKPIFSSVTKRKCFQQPNPLSLQNDYRHLLAELAER